MGLPPVACSVGCHLAKFLFQSPELGIQSVDLLPGVGMGVTPRRSLGGFLPSHWMGLWLSRMALEHGWNGRKFWGRMLAPWWLACWPWLDIHVIYAGWYTCSEIVPYPWELGYSPICLGPDTSTICERRRSHAHPRVCWVAGIFQYPQEYFSIHSQGWAKVEAQGFLRGWISPWPSVERLKLNIWTFLDPLKYRHECFPLSPFAKRTAHRLCLRGAWTEHRALLDLWACKC